MYFTLKKRVPSFCKYSFNTCGKLYIDAEVFDAEGDSISQFITDFEIDYIDPQFQEVDFNNGKVSLIYKTEGFSYIKSFVNKLAKIDLSCNSIVCFYNFKFKDLIKETGKLKYVGCFD